VADERADAARRWEPIATSAREYEAQIARAVLEAGGFDAVVEGGERVGIFGPGFIGATARGIRVLVPGDQLAAARTYLAFREQGGGGTVA
jgi:hypothetical protein